MIFDYPEPRKERRHGPAGYNSYQRYRPWLRDEFTFRCIYCLKRETWGQVTGEYDLDHFKPQSTESAGRLNYFNLVYACRRCNSVKRDQTIGDPTHLLHSATVAADDGSLCTANREAQRLIRQLDLNSPRMKQWRKIWIEIAKYAAEATDCDLYDHVVGFPNDLPDLAKLRPPANYRPEGINESWFARRSRGEMPTEY